MGKFLWETSRETGIYRMCLFRWTLGSDAMAVASKVVAQILNCAIFSGIVAQ